MDHYRVGQKRDYYPSSRRILNYRKRTKTPYTFLSPAKKKITINETYCQELDNRNYEIIDYDNEPELTDNHTPSEM